MVNKQIKWALFSLFTAWFLIYTLVFTVNKKYFVNDYFDTAKNSGIIVTGQVYSARRDDFNLQKKVVGNINQAEKAVYKKKINYKSTGEIKLKLNSGENNNSGYLSEINSGDSIEKREILEKVKKSEKSIDYLSGIIILSGTKIYHGNIEVVDKLGIDYPYALVDDRGIYYIPITSDYNWADIVGFLGGYLYVINTDVEIVKNKLFGEKIIYINIPQYKGKYVVMVLYLKDGKEWLLQIPFSEYYKSKKYLKDIFEKK